MLLALPSQLKQIHDNLATSVRTQLQTLTPDPGALNPKPEAFFFAGRT